VQKHSSAFLQALCQVLVDGKTTTNKKSKTGHQKHFQQGAVPLTPTYHSRPVFCFCFYWA